LCYGPFLKVKFIVLVVMSFPMSHWKMRIADRPHAALVLSLGFAAVLAPVLASAYAAWVESAATEKTISLTYAQDVLHRIDETANQFAEGSRRVKQAGFQPCSPQDIDLLRQIALDSNYIQAAGRISGDTLLCTSQGVRTPFALGKPSLISEHGVAEYYGVQISPQQSQGLNVFAWEGFAIIADPNLAIDVPTQGSDVELAVFVPSAPNRQRLASSGRDFHSQWFQPIGKGGQVSSFEGGYLVSRVRSPKWDLSAVAATPVRYVWLRARRFAAMFIPVGVVCGVLLTWAVSYITSVRSTFPVRVRQAARNRNFYVEYQPVIELESGRIVGAEALVRWKSRHGLIPPDHFIPMAEERGITRMITDQVLSFVAIDLPRFLALTPDFKIAINLSSAEIHSEQTADALTRLVELTGALPRNIEIEATERAFLNVKGTADAISALRKQGFRVAIDDFGTGYSSLACLQSLKLDTLKIDRAFVETININVATSQVVLYIIEMAHSLGLEMVAEGVETQAQADFLRKRGVSYAQGWLFGKPMNVDLLLRRMEQSQGADARTQLGPALEQASESGWPADDRQVFCEIAASLALNGATDARTREKQTSDPPS
jgi:sensor c-di-GMP phosphodiesterase-like protein